MLVATQPTLQDTEIFAIAETDSIGTVARLYFRDGTSVHLTKEESFEVVKNLIELWAKIVKQEETIQ